MSALAFEGEEDWGLRALFEDSVQSDPAEAFLRAPAEHGSGAAERSDDGFTRSSGSLAGLAELFAEDPEDAAVSEMSNGPAPEQPKVQVPELPPAPTMRRRNSMPTNGPRGSIGGLFAAPVQAPVQAPAQAAPVQPPVQAPVQPAPVQPPVQAPVKRNLVPTKGWRPDGTGSSGKLGTVAEGLGVGAEALETVENAAELVNVGATSGLQALEAAGAVSGATASAGESVGGVAEAVGDFINPIKGATGVPIETNNIIQTAGEMLNIRKFQRNEGKTLAGSADARSIDQDKDREAIKATKFNLALREMAQARQRGALALKQAATDRGLGADVQEVAQAQVSAASRDRWKAVGRGVIEQKRLQAIAKDGGFRMENESSMEQSAYVNDRKFAKRTPVGMEFRSTKAPKPGILQTDGDGQIVLDANGMPTRAKGEAVKASESTAAKENSFTHLAPGDFGASAALTADEGVFNDRRPGYRPETAAGRAKQGQVKAARFMQGAGQLLDGTLDTDRMVNDGRYGTAYAAKAADFAVNVGTTAGADAAAGLAAGAGPIAAPIIGIAGAVKETAGHVREELGRGLRGAGEGLESLIDRKGLAKEQDLKDQRNAWLGYQDPVPQAAQGAAAPAPAAPAGPVAGMSRAERAAVHGVDFKEQGDESVVGQRKRTWGRWAFDNTVGLAGKAVTGTARALFGVGKGVYQGAKWAGSKVGQGASWLWNKLRGERDGDTARRDLGLLRQYKDASDGEMPAEGAFRDKLGMLSAPDAKYLSELNALSADERAELTSGLDRHKRLYGIGVDGKREDAQGNRIVGDREKLLADAAAKAPSQENAVAATKEKERLQELYKQAGSGAGQAREGAITELLLKLEDEAQRKKQAMASAGTGSANPVP